ncbi:malto-oligosyltrehalose synthase [Chitiniphilus purpureus]|uniref:Malto-oligosyltrehalose synthase n=1 Tax=Chitiniphilus purpureus TaxID=2981137 RepID=A0ABY6DLX8_9NEIS|nr:malto-oligosyltrehalose synthase [Chitiniphilus sp. CD1]UXY15349.1 malto-oligosyltrehalose synthase [Chitiniphilus sp. CD1]
MPDVRATVRLQLHKGFTFRHAADLVEHFARLGISHLYVSPITTAVPGSLHGYDVTDPTQVNPELGGEAGLAQLVTALRRQRMGLIVDIVPNHMGIAGGHNPWWQDVLTWGRRSGYAHYFDIDWESSTPGLAGKVLLPILGGHYGTVLRAGELLPRFDWDHGCFYLSYHEQRLPLCPASHALLLRHGLDEPDGLALAELFEALGGQDAPQALAAAAQVAFARLRDYAGTAAGRAEVLAALVNHDARSPATTERLHHLLEQQAYRLASWTTAADAINWRRFFAIDTLAAVRVEEPEVFDAVHALILRLYEQGLIDGVRVDHVDGLTDPAGYCAMLRERLDVLTAGRPADAPRQAPWLVVEKILGPDERMRPWPVDGTTGYDFMNEVGRLLHDPAGELPLSAGWAAQCGRPQDGDFEEVRSACRRKTLTESFSGELAAAAQALAVVAAADPVTRDYPPRALHRVLTELVVQFPVYRLYAGDAALDEEDMRQLDEAVARAQAVLRPLDRPALLRIANWLGREPALGDAQLHVARRRFQQLTSPVAAKALEDTAFYRYGRLLSHNEVGGDPARFADSPAQFHEAMVERAERMPFSQLASATHDHKRGEDARARLAVLSEIAQDTLTELASWCKANAPFKGLVNGREAPSRAAELMLYQTLIGAWHPTLTPGNAAGLAALRDRVMQWLEKAQREAKQETDWLSPHEEYEAASRAFVAALLVPDSEFVARLAAFVGRIAAAGALNGLTQTVLRLTVPGVPDLYQGCEFWDHSLVDPDNRRPVDFASREAALALLERGGTGAPWSTLLARWRDGRVKQALIARLLAARQAAPELFTIGRYLPLTLSGTCAGHALAFCRSHGEAQLLVVVPLRMQALLDGAMQPALPPAVWGDTALALPDELVGDWHDVLDGRAMRLTPHCAVAGLLGAMPFAILQRGTAGAAR